MSHCHRCAVSVMSWKPVRQGKVSLQVNASELPCWYFHRKGRNFQKCLAKIHLQVYTIVLDGIDKKKDIANAHYKWIVQDQTECKKTRTH